MVYFKDHKKAVQNGAVLTWKVQGQRDANLELKLQLEFVVLPDARHGVALLQTRTSIPGGMKVTALQPNDMVHHQGRTVWLLGYNGLAIEFEGDTYPLFKVESVDPNRGGNIYFYLLPREYGDGMIAHSEDMWLE
jgi:hypothetical protein